MPATNTATVTVTVVLTRPQALAFAQFLKRASFNDYAANALNTDECMDMQEAGEALREALARAGYAPR